MKDYPSDWGKPFTSRGLSRSESFRHYVVRLSVAGKQRYIGVADTQPQGARLYDLALWKFAPWIPGKLRPNNLAAFSEIIQRNIDQEAPAINHLMEGLKREKGVAADWDESGDRQRKLDQMNAPEVQHGHSDYKAYADAVNLIQAANIRTITRLSTLRLRLSLTKLPEVAALVEEFSSRLNDAESVGTQLRYALARNERLYAGLVAPIEHERQYEPDLERTAEERLDDEARAKAEEAEYAK